MAQGDVGVWFNSSVVVCNGRSEKVTPAMGEGGDGREHQDDSRDPECPVRESATMRLMDRDIEKWGRGS